ncbi:hypothetical protein ACHAXR_010069 [Thalassiosira sp. AJA248-18]
MKSFACVAIAAIAIVRALCCMAFSGTAIFHPTRHPPLSVQRCSTTAATAGTDLTNPTDDDSTALFHPLGPPSFLANLPVGETFHLPSMNKNITRLSSLPDIFLVRDFISVEEGGMLMQSAIMTGMKRAGTRRSGANTIRKNSHLTWIDPNGINGGEVLGGILHREAVSVARETIVKSSRLFSHEVMNGLMNNAERMDYAFAEDVQVAKYDALGRFDSHHDGYGRYLTVLTYLNGVGGTYFPFGNIGSDMNEIDFTNESEMQVVAGLNERVGKYGILLVGKEGTSSYLDSTSANPKTIVEIQTGDAIAFYNYGSNGEKDLRSLHCGLTVPEEKWIATCWFRSDALTGPFSFWKRAQLLEESTGNVSIIL